MESLNNLSSPLIVFQSDDWGTQRIPVGLKISHLISETNEFEVYDTLENEVDLEQFRDTICLINNQIVPKFKFTFNVVSGNPDFKKIRNRHYQEFFAQNLNESYEFYGYNKLKLKEQWNLLLDSKFLNFQFHSREHVNYKLWLDSIRSKDPKSCVAFDLGFWGISTEFTKKRNQSFMATWDKDLDLLDAQNFRQGLVYFKDYFNINPISFVPNNYIFHKKNMNILEENGIISIQGKNYLIQPQNRRLFKYRHKIERNMGTIEKGSNSLISIVRNVQFEPSKDLFSNKHNESFTPQIDLAMNQINLAIMKGLPAVIDTHRVNYVGGRNEQNRDYGLQQLRKLVERIHNNYPDAEFISTTELTNRLNAIHQ